MNNSVNWFKLTLVAVGVLISIAASTFAADVEFRLKSADGSTKLTVKDLSSAEVFGVDSKGWMYLKPASIVGGTPSAGAVAVDSTGNVLKWYDGATWRSVGSTEVDNVTLEYFGASLRVKTGGISSFEVGSTIAPMDAQVLSYDLASGKLKWVDATGTGTIMGVLPGAGLSGGGTNATVTLEVKYDGQTIGLGSGSGSLEVKDRGITATKIATGAAVTSIASFGATQRLSGEVDVKAGANIMISQDANSLIITSTAAGGGLSAYDDITIGINGASSLEVKDGAITGTKLAPTVNVTGELGVGVPAPLEKLDVNGGVRLGYSGGANAGTVRYNSSINAFEGRNSAGWMALGSAEVTYASMEGWLINPATGSMTTAQDTFEVTVGSAAGDADSKLMVVGETGKLRALRIQDDMLTDRLVVNNNGSVIFSGGASIDATGKYYGNGSGLTGISAGSVTGVVTIGAVAGGSLTGTYPDPAIRAGAVATNEISGGAVTAAKIADSTITGSKLSPSINITTTGTVSAGRVEVNGGIKIASTSIAAPGSIRFNTPNFEVYTSEATDWQTIGTASITYASGEGWQNSAGNIKTLRPTFEVTIGDGSPNTTDKLRVTGDIEPNKNALVVNDNSNSPLLTVRNDGLTHITGATTFDSNVNIGAASIDAATGTYYGDGSKLTGISASSVTGVVTIGATAGGDLSGTYPNPAIGAGTVTAAKIADATITGGKLSPSINIATTGNIASTGTITAGAVRADSVGVGVASPTERLEIAGGIRIGDTSGVQAGTVKYNAGIKAFEGHTDTGWVSFSTAEVIYGSTEGWLVNSTVGSITPVQGTYEVAFGTTNADEQSKLYVIGENLKDNALRVADSGGTNRLVVGNNGSVTFSGAASIDATGKYYGDGSGLTGISAGAVTGVITIGAAAGGDLTGTYPAPAIGTGKVTTAKIAANAVTTNEIAAGAVTAVKIADSTITGSKLSPSINIATTGNIASTGTITAGAVRADSVGVGVASPTERLEVAGGIRIGDTSGVQAGTVKYNAGIKAFEGHTDTGWVSFSTAEVIYGSTEGWLVNSTVGSITPVQGTYEVAFGTTNADEQSKLYVIGENLKDNALRVADSGGTNRLVVGNNGAVTFSGGASIDATGKYYGDGSGLSNLPASSFTGTLPIANGGTNNSAPYTAGSVIFSDGTLLTENNAALNWDNSNARLNIGATDGTGLLAKLNVIGENSIASDTNIRIALYNDSQIPLYKIYHAKGTIASPAALSAYSILGGLIFGGYDGTAPQELSSGVVSLASENWGSGITGSNLLFVTNPNGTNTPKTGMKLSDNGDLMLSDSALEILAGTPEAKLDVRGSLHVTGVVTFAGTASIDATGKYYGDGSELSGVLKSISASSANVPGTIVSRDASGGFAADIITAETVDSTNGYQIYRRSAFRMNTYDPGNDVFTNVYVGNKIATAETGTGNNTAMGSLALTSNTTGNGDTAIGFAALPYNTEGSSNTALGAVALSNNTTGNENVGVGILALGSNISGLGNVGVGNYTGGDNKTGSENTYLGIYAGPDAGIESLDGATAVGSYTKVTRSNTVILGRADSPSLQVGIGTTEPQAKLHVEGGIRATDTIQGSGGIRLTSGGITVEAGGIEVNGKIKIADDGTTPAAGSIRYDSGSTMFQGYNGTSWIILGTGEVTYASSEGWLTSGPFIYPITTTYEVGIGTSTPQTASKLIVIADSENTNILEAKNVSNDTKFLVSGEGQVAIGKASVTPGYDLDVNGNVKIGAAASVDAATGTFHGAFNGNGTGLTGVATSTEAIGNLFIGAKSGESITTGKFNIAIGDSTLTKVSTGSENVAIGEGAALNSNANQRGSIAIGYQALSSNAGPNYVMNVGIGYQAGQHAYGTNNVYIGGSAGAETSNGTSNVSVGANAGYESQGSFNVFIGNSAMAKAGYENISNAGAIGNGAESSEDNNIAIGAAGTTVSISTPESRGYTLNVNGRARIGTSLEVGSSISAEALKITGTATIDGNLRVTGTIEGGSPVKIAGGLRVVSGIITGDGSGLTGMNINSNIITADVVDLRTTGGRVVAGSTKLMHMGGTNNMFFGQNAGAADVTSVSSSVAVGVNALSSATNIKSATAVGANALKNLYAIATNGMNNTAVGDSALFSLGSSFAGNGYNTAVGAQSLMNLNANASNYSSGNTAVGAASLGIVATGDGNTAIGDFSGSYLTGGTWNTFLGHWAAVDYTTPFIGGSTAVGALITIKKSNTVVIGDDGTNYQFLPLVKVGIGTNEPQAKLHVVGNLRVTGTIEGGSPVKIAGGLTVSGLITGDGSALSGVMKSISASSDNIPGTIVSRDATGSFIAGGVGVGSSEPNSKIMVYGSSSGAVRMHIKNTNDDGSAVYRVEAGSSSNLSSGIFGVNGPTKSPLPSHLFITNAATNGGISINTGFPGSERMHITAAGDVGIGTSEPEAKLHVVGSVNEPQFVIRANSTQTTPVILIKDNLETEILRIDGTYSGSGNTFMGAMAGSGAPLGNNNTFIGNSIVTVEGGSYNTALGSKALSTKPGGSNTAIGYQAMEKSSDTLSGINTAVGRGALQNGVTGNSYNTAIGVFALRDTGSTSNAALGYQAGDSNVSGNNNTFIGTGADVSTGYTNLSYASAIGSDARVSKSNNIVLGRTSDSVAIGTTEAAAKLDVRGNIYTSGVITADGTINTKSDYRINTRRVLRSDSLSNIMIGQQSMTFESVFASDNLAFGDSAFASLGKGTQNVAVGNQAMAKSRDEVSGINQSTAVGYASLYSNRDSGNTAIGFRSGDGTYSGGSNTLVGAYTEFSEGVNDSTAIGYQSQVTASNTIALGVSGQYVAVASSDAGGYNLYVNGTAKRADNSANWDTTSDIRLKDVNGPYNYGLSQIVLIEPFRYHFKKDNPVGADPSVEHVGMSAQELQKIIPEAVSTGANGYLSINSDPIFWALINAVKEQQVQIDELKKAVEELKRK